MASWGTPLRTLFNNVYDSVLHYVNVNISGTSGANLAQETGGNLDDIKTNTDDIKTATESLETIVDTIGTTDLGRVAIYDDSDNQIITFGSPSTIASYKSPSDFTSTYASATTLTLASLPIALTNSAQIVYIRVVHADNTSTVYVNGSGKITFQESGGTLTIYGAGSPFVNTDVFEVGINLQDKAYDSTNKLNKTQDQSPLQEQFTAQAPFVTASDIGGSDNVWKSQGQIETLGYKTIGIWVDMTVNTSTGNYIQVLPRHTDSGNSYVLETTGTYQKEIGDASIKILYIFTLDHVVPYIEIQTKAVSLGGTEATVTINYTKGVL